LRGCVVLSFCSSVVLSFEVALRCLSAVVRFVVWWLLHAAVTVARSDGRNGAYLGIHFSCLAVSCFHVLLSQLACVTLGL
jgi:hypothetical protein